MSRYTLVLLGLLAVMVVVYGDGDDDDDKPIDHDELTAVFCGENASWNLCGHICRPTCNNPKPNRWLCPRIRCTNFTAGCRCKDGYVRDTTHRTCVLLADCPKN